MHQGKNSFMENIFYIVYIHSNCIEGISLNKNSKNVNLTKDIFEYNKKNNIETDNNKDLDNFISEYIDLLYLFSKDMLFLQRWEKLFISKEDINFLTFVLAKIDIINREFEIAKIKLDINPLSLKKNSKEKDAI